jgi:hypothetical protein
MDRLLPRFRVLRSPIQPPFILTVAQFRLRDVVRGLHLVFTEPDGTYAMRTLALAAAALLASGSAALAAPASVTVAIGPGLHAKAEKEYGLRDVNRLADSLRKEVERELAKTGAYDGARIELMLEDAKPNRPTMQQMSKMGLSFESFGIGGATIEGHAIRPDGTMVPLSYSWYETDIRNAWATTTWHDAEWTFDRFASRLARGETLARR